MSKITKWINSFLNWYINFIKYRHTSNCRYPKRTFLNIMLLITYTILSSVFIWNEDAAVETLGLNLILIMRIFLQNMMTSSKYTEALLKVKMLDGQMLKEQKLYMFHNHARNKAIVVAFFIIGMVLTIWIVGFPHLLVKSFSTFMIFSACLNEIDEIILEEYHAVPIICREI